MASIYTHTFNNGRPLLEGGSRRGLRLIDQKIHATYFFGSFLRIDETWGASEWFATIAKWWWTIAKINISMANQELQAPLGLCSISELWRVICLWLVVLEVHYWYGTWLAHLVLCRQPLHCSNGCRGGDDRVNDHACEQGAGSDAQMQKVLSHETDVVHCFGD